MLNFGYVKFDVPIRYANEGVEKKVVINKEIYKATVQKSGPGWKYKIGGLWHIHDI